MPETAAHILILLSLGVAAVVVVIAASPWLCRLKVDRPALYAAARWHRVTTTGLRRASDHWAA